MAQPDYFPEANRPLAPDNDHRILHKIAGSLYNGLSITNDTSAPLPVQQADLNADIDEVTVFGGALTTYKEAASATVTYIGEAVVGSSVASAVWRIQKIDTGSAALVTWAGTGIFDQVWNNRAALTYT